MSNSSGLFYLVLLIKKSSSSNAPPPLTEGSHQKACASTISLCSTLFAATTQTNSGRQRADVVSLMGRRVHAVVGRLGQGLQAPLFFSSQLIGSHNSTLFPSGSMIHANLPFSCDSGPPMISTPPALSCAIISSRLSTR